MALTYLEFDVEYINTRKAHVRDSEGNLYIVSALTIALVAGIDCIKGFSFVAIGEQIDFIKNSSFIRV